MTCSKRVVTGYKTCADPEHRACEEHYCLMGKAMFQLKACLERSKISQPTSAIPQDPAETFSAIPEDAGEESPHGLLLQDEPVVITMDGEVCPNMATGASPLVETDIKCPSKPETGNRKVRARFGRKRTHNEELCVASCGVILGRETFFGSEGSKAVQVSQDFINLSTG
jgi:hypothetical protein